MIYPFFFKQYEDDNRSSTTKDNYIYEHQHAYLVLTSKYSFILNVTDDEVSTL